MCNKLYMSVLTSTFSLLIMHKQPCSMHQPFCRLNKATVFLCVCTVIKQCLLQLVTTDYRVCKCV